MVDKQRKKQIDEQLAIFAADFFRVESNRQSMITVTRADVAPNLSTAKIYFTVLPDSMEGAALDFAKRKRKDFHEYVKKNSHLRRIPFIDFEIDYGEKNRQHLDEISYKMK